jgi:hypothetical protein
MGKIELIIKLINYDLYNARVTTIAKKVSSYTGYRLMPKNSGGGRGYTDGFIEHFGLPGLTLELSIM